MFCFPIEHFGFVYGFNTLAVMPVRFVLYCCLISEGNLSFLNQPMYSYCQENGFSTMNYILGGISLLILFIPIAVLIKEKRTRNQTHEKESNDETTISTGL